MSTRKMQWDPFLLIGQRARMVLFRQEISRSFVPSACEVLRGGMSFFCSADGM
ncbi:MAG: hypothetical protein RL042_288 [Nitrospirota bacterium]